MTFKVPFNSLSCGCVISGRWGRQLGHMLSPKAYPEDEAPCGALLSLGSRPTLWTAVVLRGALGVFTLFFQMSFAD